MRPPQRGSHCEIRVGGLLANRSGLPLPLNPRHVRVMQAEVHIQFHKTKQRQTPFDTVRFYREGTTNERPLLQTDTTKADGTT